VITLPVGTVVISSRGLGWITQTGQHGGTDGYWISDQTGDSGTRPEPPRWPDTITAVATFAPAWCVTPAVVGRSVCRRPWPHSCGLHHVTASALAWLPTLPPRTTVTVDLLGRILDGAR
jgi:hypothetical protein